MSPTSDKNNPNICGDTTTATDPAASAASAHTIAFSNRELSTAPTTGAVFVLQTCAHVFERCTADAIWNVLVRVVIVSVVGRIEAR
jgi:hypothetical protein